MGTPVTDPDLIAKLEAAAGGARAAPPPVPVTRKNRAPGQYRSYRSQASIDAEGGGGTPGRGGVSDPKVVAELNDRAKAQELGVDYDTVSQSRDAQIAKEATGSIFPAVDKGVSGSKTQAFLKGLVGDPAAAITQFGLRTGRDLQKAIGLDPNSGSGVFSDAQVAYQEAAEKAREQEYQQGRERQGRTGLDVTRFVGNVAQPYIPGGGGATVAGKLGRAALQGAGGAALTQTDVAPGESYWGKKAGDLVVGAGAGTLVRGAGGAVARKLRPAGATRGSLRAAAEAAKELDVPVGIGQVTPNRILSRLTHGSANVVGGSPINKGAVRTEEALEGALADVASEIGPSTTGFQAGEAARKGIEAFPARMQAKANTLYNKVATLAPHRLSTQNETMSALTDTFNKFDNPNIGAELANSDLMRYARAIANPPAGRVGPPQALSFSDAEKLRSSVGKMMGESGLVNDIPRAELANVYRALTKDMRQSLADKGQPGALKAFDRASRYWNAGQQRIETLEGVLGNNRSSEQIATHITNMLKTNTKGVTQLRRSMTPDRWDQVASGVFRKMGEVSSANADELGGGFSPSQFMTQFNKLQQQDRRGYEALFGGRHARLKPKLEALSTLSNRLKDNAKLANHSGSGYYGSLTAMLGLSVANPALALKMAAGNRAFSHLMSHPRYLRWAVGAAKTMDGIRNPTAKTIEHVSRQQLARLAGMKSADSGFSDSVAEALTAVDPNTPPPQQ